jgi:hypothetical protein
LHAPGTGQCRFVAGSGEQLHSLLDAREAALDVTDVHQRPPGDGERIGQLRYRTRPAQLVEGGFDDVDRAVRALDHRRQPGDLDRGDGARHLPARALGGIERLTQPLRAHDDLTACQPQLRERVGHLQCLDPARRDGPLERHSKVVELGFDGRAPHPLLGGAQPRRSTDGHPRRPLDVGIFDRAGVGALGKAGGGEVTDRVEHAEASRTGAVIGDDERAVDEPGDQIDDLVDLEVVSIDAAHGLCRRRCASRREHGQPTEHRLLGWDEQAIAPVDRRLHGAARRQFAAHRRAQLRVPIVHPLDDRCVAVAVAHGQAETLLGGVQALLVETQRTLEPSDLADQVAQRPPSPELACRLVQGEGVDRMVVGKLAGFGHQVLEDRDIHSVAGGDEAVVGTGSRDVEGADA